MTNDAMRTKKTINTEEGTIEVDTIPTQAPSIIEDSNKQRWVLLSFYDHLGEYFVKALPVSSAQTYKIIEKKTI